MPPKRPARPLYKNARDYYKAAYRARIKEARNWNNAQITSTLAWMWLHASEVEKNISIDLHGNNAQNLPDTDDANIPDTPKQKGDPAPVAHEDVPIERHDDGHEEAGDHPGGVDGEMQHNAEPPRKKARSNTTAFSYWPDPDTINDVIHDDIGLSYPGGEEDETRWHGAYVLGQGATGSVRLWVRVGEDMLINKTLAVRDVLVNPQAWVNPMNWRDQLPREIAIQRRLHARNGHDHHIHRYYADRISFYQRKYRIFSEVCNLGCLLDALGWYSRQWRRRQNLFRWIEMHAELKHALENADEYDDDNVVVAEARKRAWETYINGPRYKERRRAEAPVNATTPEAVDILLSGEDALTSDPNLDAWETMSGIEEWHDKDLSVEFPDVIPESFLWTVFDQLVDAFTILGTGGVEGDDDEEWKEIVHGDVTLMNIFVKKAENADGIAEAESRPDTKYRTVQYEAEEFPSVVLADFDKCFFDLQAEHDVYADNPSQYIFTGSPRDLPLQGGRYPPELYWDYAGYADGELEKLTGKTDVWGVGQIMWNLLMNLPGKDGYLQQPFTDVFADGLWEAELVDGAPYDGQKLAVILSGTKPYEAPRQYSEELKKIVRKCLSYRKRDRPSFQRLKKITRKYAYGKGLPADSRAPGRLRIQVPEEIERLDIGRMYPDARPVPAAN